MSEPKLDKDNSAPAHAVWPWLWQNYLSPHKWLLAVALGLMAIEGSMLGFLAYMLQPMFDRVFIGGQAGQIWWVASVIMGLFIIRAVTSVGNRVTMALISRRTVADMQRDLLDHLMRLDLVFFSTHPPGYLIERVQGDVQAVVGIWNAVVRGAGRDLVAVISLVTVTMLIDWRWTLVGMLGAPLLVAPTLIVQRFTRKNATRAREVAADMATRLDEVFHGIGAIKLNALEDYQSKKYRTLTDQQIKSEVRQSLGTSLTPALVDIMSGLGFVGIILYGGFEIINGEKTVGQFMAFFSAMGLAFEPMRRLGGIMGLLNAASVSVGRMRSVLDERPQLIGPASPASPDHAGDITFDAVGLNFDDHAVLRGLSFRAKAGQTTALVGASGAGKSTVFNALTRLFDYQSGQIFVGKTELRALAPAELRNTIAVVSQDSLLFDDTLRANIILDQRDVSADQLQAALDASNVSEFLPKLPDGLDSPVGPRGSNLSGGQRQRVAIARAILRDAPILLLDEATSALDTASEALVQDALENLSRGRTTLVIAHRLSTIQNADKILVMDQGRVIEDGTHETLIAAGGQYALLAKHQMKP